MGCIPGEGRSQGILCLAMAECIYATPLTACMIRLLVFAWYFVLCLCHHVMSPVEILGSGRLYSFRRDLLAGCGGKWFREVENSSTNDGSYFATGWPRWRVRVSFEDFQHCSFC